MRLEHDDEEAMRQPLVERREAEGSKAVLSSAWEASAITMALCLVWTIVSSLAILVNKSILVDLAFPFPVTITWLGLVTTTVSSFIAGRFLLAKDERRGMSWAYYATHVMPTGFFMAVAFLTGNLSFMYLTLSFVQMLKASTPVVTMLLLFLFKLEVPVPRLIMSVVVISVGVGIASWGELHASALGLLSMCISVASESTRLVLMQYLMDSKGGELHPVEGLFYISSSCCIWLTAQAMFWEWGSLVGNKAYVVVQHHPVAFLTAGFAGLGVNVLAILVIKRASSLTLKVLGTCKDAVLVVVGVVFLHEVVSFVQLVGYSISLVGFVSYNLFRAIGSGAAIKQSAEVASVCRLEKAA